MKPYTKIDAVLLAVGERKIDVIKVIREVTGLKAKGAMALAENVPSLIKADLTDAEADAICEKFTTIGGGVNLDLQPCKSGALQRDPKNATPVHIGDACNEALTLAKGLDSIMYCAACSDDGLSAAGGKVCGETTQRLVTLLDTIHDYIEGKEGGEE